MIKLIEWFKEKGIQDKDQYQREREEEEAVRKAARARTEEERVEETAWKKRS